MRPSKDKYRALCLTESSIPLFSRDWWLDAVCGEDHWDVLLAEENGRIRGALPFYFRSRKVISMPPYTQTMGPWFAPVSEDTKYTSALGDRQAICTSFVEQLKAYPWFMQNFHHSITDWLPFYWGGYTQTTRYTYLLPDISRPDRLWEQMSQHLRRNINKAKDKHQIDVKQAVPAADFMRLNELTFGRQGKQVVHPDTLRRLIDVCRERGQGEIWGGYGGAGNRLHAAAFIVWQDDTAYYLAGGGDPSLRDSGAHSLVLWEAIGALSARVSQFDFEGSMLPGVERFFREFGALQTPFFTISRGKLSLVHRAWLKLCGQ